MQMEPRLVVACPARAGDGRVQWRQCQPLYFTVGFPVAGPSFAKRFSRIDAAQRLSRPGVLGWRSGPPRRSLNRKIRWGVIGSGGIARRRTIPEGILPALTAELVSVCTPNPY